MIKFVMQFVFEVFWRWCWSIKKQIIASK